MVDSPADLQDTVEDVPVVANETIREGRLWHFRDLMVNESRGPSALQHIQTFLSNHGLAVHSDVQLV